MLTNVSGFSAESITPLMILAGFGMVMGNLISGRLSDRYSPGKVGTAAQALICLMLLLIFFLSPLQMGSCSTDVPLYSRTVCCLQSEQLLIIRVAKGGEDVGELPAYKLRSIWEMLSVLMPGDLRLVVAIAILP